jgi:C-terminal processing protease CtpA/Prc
MNKMFSRLTLCLVMILALMSFSAHSDDEGLAMRHYQLVTEIRDGQWPIWQDEDASPEDLESALAQLAGALDHLAQPEVEELALGNSYLHYRVYNIRRDLLQIEARLGRPERVVEQLRYLRHFMVGAGDHASLLEELPEPVLDHPDVQRELAAWLALDRVAAAESLDTPYAEDLPVNEKIAGVSRIWTMAREYFVHFDARPELDWDQAYLEAIEKVLATDSTMDYYRELMRFVARLGDSHSNVYPPEELSDYFYARPPIRTQWVEGRVIVTGVFSAGLREVGIRIGTAIEEIDGLPVDEYVRERVAPFESASTQQDLRVRKYGYGLLAGPSTRSLTLSLRQPDGSSQTIEVERSGYTDVEWPKSFQRRQLDGGIEYLSLDSFADGRALEAFDAAWPAIQQANGLILDLRNNGGGSSWPGYRILAHLIDGPVVPAASWTRRNDSFTQAASASVQFHPLPVRPIEPIAEDSYAGPVVLLTGPRSFSAAEDMAMAFAVSQRGVIIGETTAGSTGQPLIFHLPGGGMARICAKRDTWPDGRPLVGVGVVPNIEVAPSVSDIVAGRDPVIEAAMNWIQERIR